MIDLPSPNWDPRPIDGPIDMLVLHYTGMPTRNDALARLRDPAARVSAHYLIDEDGTTYALVPENRRAWHAGLASWRGQTAINARAIGVELVNPGHQFGYRPFPAPQMAALSELAGRILVRHPIPPRNVVAHADIAPKRKEDPGELFDWPGLARQGIGIWPAATSRHAGNDRLDWRELLRRWGFGIDANDDGRAAVIAFQRHFRPRCLDGRMDAETLGILLALLDQTGENTD